ncbi:MAG TPA: DUF721 domain-containing protein [bacterium]|nr:DUF721 domain-containing protein [bacterium]
MRFPVKRAKKANPVSIVTVLNPITKDLGLESGILFENIRRNWENIVGITNAKNTRPLNVKDGILTIAVSSPVWMTQTRFIKSDFIEKINEADNGRSTKIKEIHFKLDRT